MKIDRKKILSENDFKFLKKHEVVINIAKIFSKILENYKKSIEEPFNETKYDSIKDCLNINIEVIKDFEERVNSLHYFLNEIKHRITNLDGHHTVITIHETNNIQNDTEKQFLILLNPIREASIYALKEIVKIEALNPDLLYCFFNYDTWGSTLLSEYGLCKENANLVGNDDEFLVFTIRRILGFNKNRNLSVIDEEDGDMNYKLYEMDSEAYYGSNVEVSEWYYNELNSRICSAISHDFTRLIRILRDACRKILSEIGQVKKSEIYSDDKFEIISKSIIATFTPFKDILLGTNLKQNLLKLLILIYDYKKEVEDHLWVFTQKYQIENDFHDNLEAYLTRIRKGERMNITHEGERAGGKLDFEINNCLCLELKFSKDGYTSMDEIILKHSAQLKQYMVDRDNKIGFLLCMDLSDQKEVHADRENYIRAGLIKGGRGVDKNADISPIGIVYFWIFGGKRIKPSKLKKL